MSLKLINFSQDRRGNVAILFALFMLPILGTIGAAVDFGRAHRLHTQLQIVADAATSAGLMEYRETGDVNKGQQRLLSFIDQGLEKDGMVRAREENANGGGAIGARIVHVDGSVIDPLTSSVRPVLRTTIDTPFLSLLGTEEMEVQVFTKGAVASNTLQGTKNLELSLMLDVSGSMSQTSASGTIKVEDMKDAAQDFLDIVMPDDLAVDNRRVGLVPFADRVNVGSFAPAATGYVPTIQVQNGTTTIQVPDPNVSSWLSLSNCRSRVRSFTQYASLTSSQAEQFCRDNYSTRVNGRNTEFWTPARLAQEVPRMVTRHLRTCITERQGSERSTDVEPGPGAYVGVNNPNSTVLADQYSSSTNNCSIPQIRPLTTDKQSLKDHVATFGTYGGTAGHVGTAWSWYMLSPEWNRFWSSGDGDVAEYDDTNTIKAAVIMTDGEYNSNFVNPSASQQAIDLCTQMKAKGVRVYTIGFDMSTNVNDPARQTLVACASPNSYYFPYDGNALREAFNEIGNSLVTIVTKSSDSKTVLIQE